MRHNPPAVTITATSKHTASVVGKRVLAVLTQAGCPRQFIPSAGGWFVPRWAAQDVAAASRRMGGVATVVDIFATVTRPVTPEQMTLGEVA